MISNIHVSMLSLQPVYLYYVLFRYQVVNVAFFLRFHVTKNKFGETKK